MIGCAPAKFGIDRKSMATAEKRIAKEKLRNELPRQSCDLFRNGIARPEMAKK